MNEILEICLYFQTNSFEFKYCISFRFPYFPPTGIWCFFPPSKCSVSLSRAEWKCPKPSVDEAGCTDPALLSIHALCLRKLCLFQHHGDGGVTMASDESCTSGSSDFLRGSTKTDFFLSKPDENEGWG